MPRLDVMAVVTRVLLLLLDFNFIIRVTGIWFAVVAMADLIEFLLLSLGAGSLIRSLVGLAGSVVGALALAACAVTVHRSILLLEPPFRLRLGRTEVRYALRTIFVLVPLLIPVLVVGTVALVTKIPTRAQLEALVASPLAPSIAWLSVTLLMAIVILPLALALPALAIGNEEFQVGDGWSRAFYGNFARATAAYVFAFATPSLVLSLVARGVVKILGSLGSWSGPLAYGTNLLVTFLDTVLWAAVLSCTYAALVRRDPEFTTPLAEP